MPGAPMTVARTVQRSPPIAMTTLRLVTRDEMPPRDVPRGSRHPAVSVGLRWLPLAGLALLFVSCSILVWWSSTASTREIQALPDAQRIPLYHRTLANLSNVCDPAAPRSLRDFCRDQAELAMRFRECDADPACQTLSRRHLRQPRR